MRRPQGFERPVVPPAETPTDSAPPARKGAGIRRPVRPPAAQSFVRGSWPSRGAASTEPNTESFTEPITVQPASALPGPLASVSPLRPGSGASPAPTPPADTRSTKTQPADKPAAPLTPAGARLKLRAARRARKRYEREEVRRFTWRSRRRRNAWLASLGVTVVLAAFVVVGVYSPLMALRTIEVVGANRIPADKIQAALGDQLGTPLPLVDLAEVKKDLSEFTLIQSYVTESRPPATLVVRIVEREPVGALATGAGFDLVDAAGVVIQSSPERPAGYATIDARSGSGSAGFLAATAVIAALPESIRTGLDTVTAATKDDVTLTLVGGARVVWGSAEKSEYKAVVLAALIVSHPVGTVGEYDVSSPDSAVLR
ncbi:FtsQ-type POTRA domain-containing protein [Cryobacterium sp. TMT1-21]|uniref:FtsQ-type POTRA domain-containing protein n=1 Tax=Cryobacterium shii TaxID=1259235 RepID=A0AAQ2HGG0_9MICO|nr:MULTISPECIES: FtsQ-type POTRA domain-containing protein [Cryobacterium]TFC52047.1 FtsQ-type POTRA domain-containing protein [Cryobacterium shii]TFC85468.1 FtsQ-type POTRA domain-containing protein [Cryobacterium sp. TmT2-59]TFD06949.1 FtsQ-type POTRA domain-containing protein [Cryobacterium sp. TMT1-21]TFD16842.1 FtsQ-type POTRA domain-containing protein [Cryobacterium sp. TMT2-23]TFD19942.1 FtsQ-type POTRA domain-containing protein [Cryobacterium sp. TMT4-10]